MLYIYIYGNMDPINISQTNVSIYIYIYQHHGSDMGLIYPHGKMWYFSTGYHMEKINEWHGFTALIPQWDHHIET